MKPLVINNEAADELDEAVLHYEKKSPGICISRAVKVSEAFRRIQRNPQLYLFHSDTNLQKCFVRRFPYSLLYIEIDEHTVFLAVAHQERRPDYWKFRQTAVSEMSDESEAYGDRKS